tara:strand:+ start:69 stop:791 length:723 start_codon:yes stop_codon:yes gene_type:complete
MKVINQVHSTNDYSIFSKLGGNRNINKAHLSRLKKSIKEESLEVPIIVNEKFEIIDGQTRFESWKDLNKPILFIIVAGYGLSQVQRLNSNIRNWNLKDFTDCYCDLGNKEYIKYREFKKTYGLGDYESIAMLSGQVNGSGKNFDRFRNGLFKITSYKKACNEAEKIIKIMKFYEGYKRRSFVFAMLHLINHSNFDFQQLVTKLKYQSSKLVDCTNKEQYLNLLQDIYNFKASKKVNLIYN